MRVFVDGIARERHPLWAEDGTPLAVYCEAVVTDWRLKEGPIPLANLGAWAFEEHREPRQRLTYFDWLEPPTAAMYYGVM